ncbi:MAG: hypothetical protein R2755_30120 [Acidimicrobiales bacterium]
MRWAHSGPLQPHVEAVATQVREGSLLAGDAFAGPKVEGPTCRGPPAPPCSVSA